MRYLIFLSFWFVFAVGCNTAQLPDPEAGSCDTLGTVTNFEGLDGCGLLIVTDDGLKLLPAVIDPPGFTLKANQRVRFSYVEAEEQMSICMAEDQIVRITCIQLINGPGED